MSSTGKSLLVSASEFFRYPKMKNIKYAAVILFSFSCLIFFMLAAYAQQTGESISKQGIVHDDLYMAGGNIHIRAEVTGDVVAAGGRVFIRQKVKGDVIAAAGRVLMMAEVSDDVRLAGGDVTLSGHVGDDAILAGGSVTVTPESIIEGRGWLSGGYLDIAGHFKQELKAAGGRIILNARVDGDVELTGEWVNISSSTVINGDLIYRSPNKAEIDNAAKINGTIKHIPAERPGLGVSTGEFIFAGLLVFLGVLATAILTGLVLYVALPGVFHAGSELAKQQPLKYLGLGFLILAVPPAVMGVLIFTLIGLPLAIALFFLYGLFLLFSIFIGIFYAGDRLIRLIKKDPVFSKRQHIVYFSTAILLFLLLNLIPFVGNLVFLFLIMTGMGVLSQIVFNIFKEQRIANS